ncbi:MAG: TIGR00303 family protein [Candidatus Atelocyanobacterium thalassa]
MLYVYSEKLLVDKWISTYNKFSPLFICILGFTETALIPDISLAGTTSEARKYTALADAEFLVKGISSSYKYSLPSLVQGISPVFITRAIIEHCQIPFYLFNTGLPSNPSFPCIDLRGKPANCLSTGKALPLNLVTKLFYDGLAWGKKLTKNSNKKYLVLGECVVGGTTTALAVLKGLGVDASQKVNSSYPYCDHNYKDLIVKEGFKKANYNFMDTPINPFELIASVGDPMQITVAGMAISASLNTGLILAGGTQMLAVYQLIKTIIKTFHYEANLENIIVGTTRWVLEDKTGDTLGLAKLIGEVPLLATQLNFSNSCYEQLQVYEEGYIKEGMGAGACAITSSISYNLTQKELLSIIESLVNGYHIR